MGQALYPYPPVPEPPLLPLLPKEQATLITQDGVALDADIYRPQGEGPFPVLLMRQPYGRAIASTVVYAHPRWYAAHGYIVVVQDVRGRGTSGGTFDLFAQEAADGRATLEWVAALPGSTGDVGMYGFSYQGMTQLYAASAQPPALKVLCPAMVAPDLYSHWAYEGGAFCLQTNLAWALQLAAETARRQGDGAAYHQLYQAAHQLPLDDPYPANPALLRELAPDSFYHDWLRHCQTDAYWTRRSPQLTAVDLPMLHVGGWFDPYLRGTLSLYHALAARSQYPQHLLIGPWGHLPWGRQLGAVDYGEAASSPVDWLQLRWFDQFLKGVDTSIAAEPLVALFQMGSNQWRMFSHWPQSGAYSYFLTSNGLANVRPDAGGLVTKPGPRGQDTLVHDPWRPVPALGGHAALPPGTFERTAIDDRLDVLTYTTLPFTESLTIIGEPWVELFCQTDAISFDCCVVLSEVNPKGVYNLTQGYKRVDHPSPSPLLIPLQPTCVQIASGHALRLSVSAACFPAYALNPGTGDSPAQTQLLTAQVITLVLTHGGDRPSRICLPEGSRSCRVPRGQTMRPPNRTGSTTRSLPAHG